jgi:hypothetical protein
MEIPKEKLIKELSSFYRIGYFISKRDAIEKIRNAVNKSDNEDITNELNKIIISLENSSIYIPVTSIQEMCEQAEELKNYFLGK